MVHRLWFLLVPLFLLIVAQPSDGQSTALPQPTQAFPPPLVAEKVPQPAPAKELTDKELDGLIEKAFGSDCEELRRPIRVWLPDVGTVIAAKDASVMQGKLGVRYTSASLGSVGTLERRVFRDADIVVNVSQPIILAKDVQHRTVLAVEIQSKNSTITLTTQKQGAGNSNQPMLSSLTIQQPTLPLVSPQELILPPVDMVPPPPMGMPGSRGVEVRFKFKIDPKATLADLLPTPAKMSAKLPLWTNEDLAKFPELTFGEPISKDLPKIQAMEKTAHVMAKINHLNRKKTDGFMLAMLDQRTDLRGLPFLMGDDCRTREEQAKVFSQVADALSRSVAQAKVNGNAVGNIDQVWAAFTQNQGQTNQAQLDRSYRALVAASLQIFMPEAEPFRFSLARNLATVPHIDATKALAQLAIFSPEESVRSAAIDGLKLRRERDYADILIQGFRYPLPAVSKRAAEALVKLERKDLLANLIEVLESPDPRLPVTEKRDGKDVTFVRELVKVNHHQNCLLCHAPGNTDNTPEGVLKVAVPLPNEPLPKAADGGGYQSTPPATPDIVVRLDMTYLRQDFSQMMPVSDAHPWPEMQRFDFLVRTRTLTAAEAQAYEDCCELPEPGHLSPYHRSALYALRELTGRDTEPTAAAWRKLLKMPK